MGYRLQLLQGFPAIFTLAGEPIPLRSYMGILSVLGFARTPLNREQVIGWVWPDVPLHVGRNRLRVALVKLRKLMPGAIVESDKGLAFDPEVVSSDVAKVRGAFERAQDSVTAVDEMETLVEALSALDGGLVSLPGSQDFAHSASNAWLRVGELATETSRFEQAREASRSATVFNSDSGDAWAAYLLASWRTGATQAAIDEAKLRAPKKVQTDAQFRSALTQVRSKQPGSTDGVSSAKGAMWFDILSVIEQSRPDLMRSILSAPQTLSLAGKQPRVMHDLLASCTPLDIVERDLVWERSVARMIGLKAWLGDAKGVLTSAPALIESSADDQILRAMWNAIAVAHSLLRHWDEAYEALERTMEYSQRLGSEPYELATRGNGAFFKMQQARFDESLQEYDAILSRLTEMSTPQAIFEHAIAMGNRALIPVFKGEWAEAQTQLEAAMEARTKNGLAVQMGILHASIGLAHAHLGRLETVVTSMRTAFLEAFESDSFRSSQFTFELAAATVSALGDPAFGRSLADWVKRWRQRTEAPRSAAEQLLVSRIPAVAGSPLGSEPTTVGKETMLRLRTLAGSQRGVLSP